MDLSSTGVAYAWADGIGLRIELPGNRASMLLRRRDLREERRFSEYYGAAVGAKVVSRFLPGWQSLAWRKVPAHLLSQAEMVAEDGEFQVNLTLHGVHGEHADALHAFHRFMDSAVPD